MLQQYYYNHEQKLPSTIPIILETSPPQIHITGDTSTTEGLLQPASQMNPVASIYHLYRVKQKLLAVSSLVAELERREMDVDQSKYARLRELQSRTESLKRAVSCARKQVLAQRRQCERKRKYVTDRARSRFLLERQLQYQAQKENLDSHVKDEALSVRIKNAYLKSLRQQFLHALLSNVFPISCHDLNYASVVHAQATESRHGALAVANGGVSYSGNGCVGGIESTLLSSVAPSSLNQDQFTQLDEAIHTHYLGQGFWTSEDENDEQYRNQYSYGIVCSQLSQPEKYDQLVNLIDKLSSSRKTSLNGCHRQHHASNELPKLPTTAAGIQLRQDLTASLPGASTLAKQLNIEESIVSTAYEQSAALSHLSQFVHICSYILSVPLPFRPSYSFFMDLECTPRALHDAICKLDLNIIFLCLSQGVAAHKLRPDHNIRNLIHCFSTTNPHLGESHVSFTASPELQVAVKDFFHRYNSLNQLRFNSAANLGDEDPADWEELPDKVNLTPEELQHIRMISTPSAAQLPVLPLPAVPDPVAILSSFGSWLSTRTSSSLSNTFNS